MLIACDALQAVEALAIVGKAMPGSVLQEHFAPMVKRLSTGDFFPSRISAASLHATVYQSTPNAQRPALRKQFEALAKDEMPMVRRAAFGESPIPPPGRRCGGQHFLLGVQWVLQTASQSQ